MSRGPLRASGGRAGATFHRTDCVQKKLRHAVSHGHCTTALNPFILSRTSHPSCWRAEENSHTDTKWLSLRSKMHPQRELPPKLRSLQSAIQHSEHWVRLWFDIDAPC